MLYIKRLELEYVRCFGKKQKIDFIGDDGKISQWTVILGDNGTGKTSILRSIVSMLPTPQSFLTRRGNHDTQYDLSINNGWRNAWNLKHKDGEDASSISLEIAECAAPFGSGIEASMALKYIQGHQNNMTSEAAPPVKFDTRLFSPVYCFAYGANRKMSQSSLAEENIEKSSETLFFDYALLPNSSEYFLRIDYEAAKSKSKKSGLEKNKVKELLLKVLPNGVKDIRVTKTGRLQREVQVDTPFGWVGINELSLGYKTSIAWLIDFASKMMYYHHEKENPFEEPAILILDEIDLHMHPAWQREIIDNLTKTFTKTQFIVTAHSPLIVQAALDSNLVLLKRIGDHVKVENTPEVIKTWRIDQVLTSDLFGLKEARPKKTEKKINRRLELLKKPDRTRSEEDELNRLNEEIYDMPIGETRSEMDAMDILKDFAKKVEAAKKNP